MEPNWGLLGGHDDGELRADFPGGFPGDKRDAFTEAGRTQQENDIYQYVQRLLTIRKAHKALQSGELIHFRPFHEVYVYFRTTPEQRVMVVLNHNKEKQKISLAHFADQLTGAVKLRELITGEETDNTPAANIILEGMTAGIYEVLK
jgi:glycosidase